MKIYKTYTDEEGVSAKEFVENFEEKVAPSVTLGGRLLALLNETGFEHIAVTDKE